MRAGVAIVGGGIMGAWALLEASRGADPLGSPAVMFESAPSDGLAVVASGLVSEAFVDPQLGAMARRGMREVANFETNTGRAIHFARPGALVLGPRDLEGIAAALKTRRLDGAVLLRGKELRRAFRGLDLGAEEGALWLPDVGQLAAERYLSELLGLARTRGAITRMGTAIENICLEGGKVVGLETSHGFCETGQVIVTAVCPGVKSSIESVLGNLEQKSVQRCRFDSPLVAEEAGQVQNSTSEGTADLFEDPARLESFFTAAEPPIHAHPALVDCANGLAVTCAPMAGQLHAMAIHGDAPLCRGANFSADALANINSRLPFHGDSLVPAASGEQHIEQTEFLQRPSGSPLICEVPGAKGLFVALGLGERSIELAPSLAEGLQQLTTGRPLSAFSPDLFGLGIG
jgi:glycine/D-amino acid oxidase-like deaminating enzyme